MSNLSPSSLFLIFYLTYLDAPLTPRSAAVDILGVDTPWDSNDLVLPGLTPAEAEVVKMFFTLVGSLDRENLCVLLGGLQYLDEDLRRAEKVYARWYSKTLARRIRAWIWLKFKELGVMGNVALQQRSVHECAETIAPRLCAIVVGLASGVQVAPEVVPFIKPHLEALRESEQRRSVPLATPTAPEAPPLSLARTIPTAKANPSLSLPRSQPKPKPKTKANTSQPKNAVVSTSRIPKPKAPQQPLVAKSLTVDGRFYDVDSALGNCRVQMQRIAQWRRKNPAPVIPLDTLWEPQSPKGSVGVTGIDELDDTQLAAFFGRAWRFPTLFAAYRSIDDPHNTSWNKPTSKEERNHFFNPSPGFTRVRLEQHQLVALCALFHRSFSRLKRKPGEPAPTNVLVADTMGFGKTILGLAFIAEIMFLRAAELLKDIISTEEADAAYPAFIAEDERFSFMDHGAVRGLPHLIIVPNALLAQWISEIRRFFMCGFVDIFEVPRKQEEYAEMFLDPDGPYHQSPLDDGFKIVVCTDTTFTHFCKAHYNPDVDRGTIPEEKGKILTTAASDSFLTMDFNVALIDEAHDMRGGKGAKYTGLCALPSKAIFIVAFTGTPIYAQPHDALNIFRVLAIRGLHGPAAQAFLQQHNRIISRARHADDNDSVTEVEEQNGPTSLQLWAIAQAEEPEDDDSAPSAVVLAKVDMCKAMFRRAGHAMIRRTHTSTGADGTLIVKVPPKLSIHYHVVFAPAEQSSLNSLIDPSRKTRAVMIEGQRIQITTANFMSIYRTEVSFPLFPGGPSSSQASRRGSQSSQPPKKKRGKTAVGEVKYKPFTSLSDFTARAGTKLKHLVRLLSYLLADDEALPVTQFDRSSSEMIYPALPIRDTAPPRTRKIIVSIAFTMMVKAFLSAFALHNISAITFTGKATAYQRVRILKQWKSSKTSRVLLMSQVGAVGLNLTEASVVIHYDIHWSELHEDQIDARACRYGQTRTVHCYHIIGKRSSDVFMDTNAREKPLFLAALTQQDDDYEEEAGDTAQNPIELIDDEAVEASADEDEEPFEVSPDEDEEPFEVSPDEDEAGQVHHSSPFVTKAKLLSAQWTYSDGPQGGSGLSAAAKRNLVTAGTLTCSSPKPPQRESLSPTTRRNVNSRDDSDDDMDIYGPYSPPLIQRALSDLARLSITPRPSASQRLSGELTPPPPGQWHLAIRSPTADPDATQLATPPPPVLTPPPRRLDHPSTYLSPQPPGDSYRISPLPKSGTPFDLTFVHDNDFEGMGLGENDPENDRDWDDERGEFDDFDNQPNQQYFGDDPVASNRDSDGEMDVDGPGGNSDGEMDLDDEYHANNDDDRPPMRLTMPTRNFAKASYNPFFNYRS
ncbi:P-loop containing nucleoside triphosphate hydrolase protein [Crepidotus variabilis]|uniref:P-loop containing nucleoside triphosphate hydrolase protein n=1 Tax=Crepidotus variabilis TaxID=179855 RepID=A0A9P6EIQ7_9AGAR|nr:P-loop containing nucleoside triphosphate hydrolase protein [Crepidotus variabilis]